MRYFHFSAKQGDKAEGQMNVYVNTAPGRVWQKRSNGYRASVRSKRAVDEARAARPRKPFNKRGTGQQKGQNDGAWQNMAMADHLPQLQKTQREEIRSMIIGSGRDCSWGINGRDLCFDFSTGHRRPGGKKKIGKNFFVWEARAPRGA